MEQFENKSFEEIWEKLGDIPVNEYMELDAPFLDYPIGTDCTEIWQDLEEYFNISIGKYLDGEPYKTLL